MYVTSEQGEVSIGEKLKASSYKTNIEEADTRIVVHVLHALKWGVQTICAHTVDPDVVVILAGTFRDLVATQPLTDVAFGMGHSNAIWESLEEQNHERYLCSTHFRL